MLPSRLLHERFTHEGVPLLHVPGSRRALVSCAAAALVVVAASCGLGDLTAPGADPGSVEFAVTGDSLVALRDSLRLVTDLASDPQRGPTTVRWTSSDPDIASVDQLGTVHGLRIGRATITAELTAPDLAAPIEQPWPVTVVYASIAVDAVDSLTGLGERRAIAARGVDAQGSADALVAAAFASGDTTVVALVGPATLEARGEGVTYVTAAFGNLVDSIAVRVRRVAARVEFARSDLILTALERDTTAEIRVWDTQDSLVASPRLTWSSSDETAVSVTPDGILRAHRVAPATITASSDTVSAALSVLVGREAASLSIAAGNGQATEVGTAVAIGPAVIARDAGGSPMPDVVVVFSRSGGGAIVDSVQRTDDSGVATLGSWNLGTAAGVYAITAAAGSHTVSFTATATPGPASPATSALTVSRDTIAANEASTLTLRTRDAYGNDRVSGGYTASFSASGGTSGGVLSAATDHGDGTYSATFTGVTAGTARTMSAAIDGQPITTPLPTVTVVAGPPAQMAINAGDQQSAPAGTAVAIRPSVVLRDAFNNPVSGVAVTFEVAGGGGTITGATPSTNSTGNATVGGWTLGTVVGANALTARAGTLSVAFDATATPGPASLAASTATVSDDTVAAGSQVTFTLRARDQYGNAIQSGGLVVAFTVSGASNGSVGATTDLGDGTYTAAFTGETAGSASTVGATIGGSPVTSALPNVTVVPGTATQIAIAAGNAQTATVATAVANAPTVILRDAYGNPVPGATVAFTVGSGGGQVTGGTSVTDAGGAAAPGSWQLGTIAGSNTLDAVAGALTVTFIATGTPGPASTATSQVTASPTSVGSLGNATITLQVLDQYGNALTTGGLAVTFNTDEGSMDPAVTDHGNGTYTATFNAPVVVLGQKTATIRAFIAGNEVTDTATVTVTVL